MKYCIQCRVVFASKSQISKEFDLENIDAPVEEGNLDITVSVPVTVLGAINAHQNVLCAYYPATKYCTSLSRGPDPMKEHPKSRLMTNSRSCQSPK